MSKYKLQCLDTLEYIEDNYTLKHTDKSLLRAEYNPAYIVNDESGVWKFSNWLPTEKISSQSAGTRTYKATELGLKLGLENLWVAFHGYWPEKDGLCPTGTFKDMEAVPTLQRLRDHNCAGVICASAGNTARAFTHFCALEGFPLIVIISEAQSHRVWLRKEIDSSSVKLIVIEDGTYQDAKEISKLIAKELPGWQLEGGAHNIARRDGIGTLILESYNEIGTMPDYYFQGVSGGPGPIGVFEMMKRVRDSGEYDGNYTKIFLSQNLGHSPIHNAWQDGRNYITDDDLPSERKSVYSDYLLNESPSYQITGGVFDILKATDGDTAVVTKEEALEAKAVFEQIEGIDIMSPAAVALASLIKAKEHGKIKRDDIILLNVSGAGVDRIKEDFETKNVAPWIKARKENILEELMKKLS